MSEVGRIAVALLMLMGAGTMAALFVLVGGLRHEVSEGGLFLVRSMIASFFCVFVVGLLQMIE